MSESGPGPTAGAGAPGPARSPWVAFVPVAVGTFMATLDSSIVNVALPTLQHEFGVAVTLIEWVSIAYLTITTGLLLPFGKLGDTAGRRRIYLIGMVLFTLGSALCGLAGSAAFLIGSRVVQGVGAAMLSSNSVALVTAAFPREIRGRALGAVGAVVGLGLTIGPPLGGLLLSTLGWHAIFYVNLPFGIAAIVMALRVMAPDEPGDRPVSFDPWGAGLLLAGLVALTLVLSRGQAWGWTSPHTLGAAAVLVAAAGLFVRNERRSRDPLLPLSYFANPVFASSMASLFLSFVAMFAAVFLVPFYLQNVAGYGPATVGGVLVVVPLMLIFVSTPAGSLSDRIGTRALAAIGLALMGAGMLVLAAVVGSAGAHVVAIPALIAGLLVAGLGQSAFQPANSNAAMSSAPPTGLGLAGGMLATMRNFGMLVGIGLAAAIYEGREAVYRAASRPALEAAGLGMRDAFLAAAVVAFLAAATVVRAQRGVSTGVTPASPPPVPPA